MFVVVSARGVMLGKCKTTPIIAEYNVGFDYTQKMTDNTVKKLILTNYKNHTADIRDIFLFL